MMVLFWFLMFVHFGLGIWGTFDNADDGDDSNVKNQEIYEAWYILDRIYLIMLYKFLLILKRVQLMTDGVFDDVD